MLFWFRPKLGLGMPHVLEVNGVLSIDGDGELNGFEEDEEELNAVGIFETYPIGTEALAVGEGD